MKIIRRLMHAHRAGAVSSVHTGRKVGIGWIEMVRSEKQIDWIEEGRKHFLATKLHPEKLAENYPTQDIYSPKDEADFILGFKAAKGEWDRGKGLNGLGAYSAERDEASLVR